MEKSLFFFRSGFFFNILILAHDKRYNTDGFVLVVSWFLNLRQINHRNKWPGHVTTQTLPLLLPLQQTCELYPILPKLLLDQFSTIYSVNTINTVYLSLNAQPSLSKPFRPAQILPISTSLN